MSDQGTAPAGGLFDGVLARGPVHAATSDAAWLQAMLDFEAALARAEAQVGLFPSEQAEQIAAACRADRFDVAALGRAAAADGNPVPALVKALRALLPGAAAAQVHRGATSQDVIDSAAMLVARRSLPPLLDDLEGAAAAAASLAVRHRATLMAGRTLLQHAQPITFGLQAAGWLCGLDEAAVRLHEVARKRLAVQLGGAAGTLAAFGALGSEVVDRVSATLGLATPTMPWHTQRTRVVELAAALGVAAGAIEKPARDVTLLASTEVAEVAEGQGQGQGEGDGAGARGGSSAMPHKRNPVAAVAAVACARRAPGLVATLLAAMAQEHQRAAGAWHAEWRPLTDLLITVGSAAAWLRDGLGRVTVAVARMRANLDASGGLTMSERLVDALGPLLPEGRPAAQDLIRAAARAAADRGVPFAEELARNPAIGTHLPRKDIDALLDPAGYLGSATMFVDRALAAHAAQRAEFARDRDAADSLPPGERSR